MRGNCYVTSEALYHLLGGKAGGLKPMCMPLPWGGTHWFLRYVNGPTLDPTYSQFTPTQREQLDYNTARGKGFLTRLPSKRARALMRVLVWQGA